MLNEIFGKLKITSEPFTGKWGKQYVNVVCECGTEMIVPVGAIKSNSARKMCNKCSLKMKYSGAVKQDSRMYILWQVIVKSGEICEDWKEFQVFTEWSLDNGYNVKKKLVKINEDEGFSPINCKWARLDKKGKKRYTYRGKQYTFNGLWKKFSPTVDRDIVLKRLRSGWPYLEAFLLPVERAKPILESGILNKSERFDLIKKFAIINKKELTIEKPFDIVDPDEDYIYTDIATEYKDIIDIKVIEEV